ncbi:MAG: hypothetical protein GF317_19160 [Candidatus Lokiarchaeota archaeon]|nr:hypothetical protein [Candidatus Lokiarchaeota archaeon]MBD3201629.1 hypothetical protein [Candidatus Lokiarchaeota archaeon]
MALADLTEIEFTRGFLSLIFVIISLLIGLKLLFKYFKYSQKTFITVALTWIFLTISWWWPSFNFISLLFFGVNLNTFSYLILANAFIAPALVSWLYSFTSIAYKEIKKKVMSISLVIFVPYEAIFFILLFIEPSLIGVERSPNVVSRSAITLTVAIIGILIALITGFLMSRDALKSSDMKIKWKGRFLLAAFVLFTISAALDSISWTSIAIIAIIRILLIVSAFAYYLGFFLPDRIADLLIKDEVFR